MLFRSPAILPAPYDLPDAMGHFGRYGGVFVAETLIRALDQLRDEYARYQHDPEFIAEFERELKHFVGRPSPIYHARRWSDTLGGAQIYLKREDLNHTGAHKINNCIGQALVGDAGRGADLPETRRPQPHRRAQDQQHQIGRAHV